MQSKRSLLSAKSAKLAFTKQLKNQSHLCYRHCPKIVSRQKGPAPGNFLASIVVINLTFQFVAFNKHV